MSFAAPLLFPYKPRGFHNIYKNRVHLKRTTSFLRAMFFIILRSFLGPSNADYSSWLLNLHVFRGSLLCSRWHFIGRRQGWENKRVLTPLNAYSSVFTAMKYVCNRLFSTIWTTIMNFSWFFFVAILGFSLQFLFLPHLTWQILRISSLRTVPKNILIDYTGRESMGRQTESNLCFPRDKLSIPPK